MKSSLVNPAPRPTLTLERAKYLIGLAANKTGYKVTLNDDKITKSLEKSSYKSCTHIHEDEKEGHIYFRIVGLYCLVLAYDSRLKDNVHYPL